MITCVLHMKNLAKKTFKFHESLGDLDSWFEKNIKEEYHSDEIYNCPPQELDSFLDVLILNILRVIKAYNDLIDYFNSLTCLCVTVLRLDIEEGYKKVMKVMPYAYMTKMISKGDEMKLLHEITADKRVSYVLSENGVPTYVMKEDE